MNIVRMLVLVLTVMLVSYQTHNFYSSLPTPIRVTNVDSVKVEAEKSLIALNAPTEKMERLVNGVVIASKATGVRPALIATLVQKESTFKENAVSSKGYKGLMQTRVATMTYWDVDILHGAREFENKLKITNGDFNEAMALYKGGRNPLARKQAADTIRLYKWVLSRIQV